MSDIKRYKIDFEQLIKCDNGWLMNVEDHIKAIEAAKWNAKGNLHALECANNDLRIEAGKTKKLRETIAAQAKEIEGNKTYTSGLEGIIREQTKEIERLKEASRLLAQKCSILNDSFAEKLSLNSFIQHVLELTK